MKKLIVIVLLILGVGYLVMNDDTNNLEVRTMHVVTKMDNITVLKDGNGEMYELENVNIVFNKDLLVTVNNQGTDTFEDDIIIEWSYAYR